MTNEKENKSNTIGPFRRFLLTIAGTDLELAAISPLRDLNTICAKVLLLVLAAIFMAAELAIIAHLTFVDDGSIHFELIAGAVFIAFMVAAIDAYIFLRSSPFEAGMAELRRAGAANLARRATTKPGRSPRSASGSC